MSKINWVHLSDLHFKENDTRDITNIRSGLIDFLGTLNIDPPKYLFISGDIFFQDKDNLPESFSSINDNARWGIVTKAADFIVKVIKHLGITPQNVFIVPGNHDSQKSKRKQFANVWFTHFCQKIGELYGSSPIEHVNFCCGPFDIESSESSIADWKETKDFEILMLDTSCEGCKRGRGFFASRLQNDIVARLPNVDGNEHKPLFILAHNYFDSLFGPLGVEALANMAHRKENYVQYICGHTHHADVKHSGTETNIEICGGTLIKIRKPKDYADPVFLTGSLDTDISETVVSFYKWSSDREGQWIKDRNISPDNAPYNERILPESNPKKDIIIAKSETEAATKFFNYLIETLQEEARQKPHDRQYEYFKSRMDGMLSLLRIKRPSWNFHSRFLEEIACSPTTNLNELIQQIRQEWGAHKKLKEQLRNSINLLADDITEENTGILLYSKSTRVTDFLKDLSPEIRQKVIVYVCSGDIRSYGESYRDGKDIAGELYDRISDTFHVRTVELTPDMFADKMMREKKVKFVLLGAHFLHPDTTGGYTHITNTTGTGLIIDLAEKYNISCFVIADTTKEYVDTPLPLQRKKIEIPLDPSTGPTISSEFDPLERVDIRRAQKLGLLTIITEKGKVSRPSLSPEIIRLLIDDILKDKRTLKKDDTDNTIKKVFLSQEATPECDIAKLECDILRKLSAEGIRVPSIIQGTDKHVHLEYSKGIRVFNLIVSIDDLKKNYEPTSEEYNRLNIIVGDLLKRCEKKQTQIQRVLYDNFRNAPGISPYPEEKLTNLIRLIFRCATIDARISMEKVIDEMKKVYEIFARHAIVPFRDASTKNMILAAESLYLGNFGRYEDKRNDHIRELFENNQLGAIIRNADIVDIDFSSCVNLTTPYDDVISFRFHERTAPYFSPENISIENIGIWNDFNGNDWATDEVLLATSVVRFLRFGGRKFLYRMFPKLHTYRFRHDNEACYFDRLRSCAEELKLPESTEFFREIINILNSGNQDVFRSIPDNKEIAKIIKKGTYLDVFPF